jgi:hypothetical protein
MSLAASIFGKVFQVQAILRAILGPLHFSQAGQRAHSNWNPKQVAFDSVVDQLGVGGNSLRALNDVERPESGHGRDVSTHTDHAEVTVATKGPVVGGRQSRSQLVQNLGQALQVVRVGIGDDVQVLGAAYETVGADGDTANDDEINAALVQGREQRAEVEFSQRTLAAPWIALSCLQSACTRARRSLIDTRRSASRRMARACCSSSRLPLSVFVATRASLATPLAFLALAVPAHATYDPLGSGTIKLSKPAQEGPAAKPRRQTKHTPLIAKVGGSQLKIASSSKLAEGKADFATGEVVGGAELYGAGAVGPRSQAINNGAPTVRQSARR